MNLQSYYDMVKGDTEGIEEYVLVSEEEIVIDNIPAMKAVYTGTSVGYPFKTVACILVNAKVGWDIELGCDPECWDIYEDTFNTMINSFKVLD